MIGLNDLVFVFGLVIGLMVGASIGAVVAAMCRASKDSDTITPETLADEIADGHKYVVGPVEGAHCPIATEEDKPAADEDGWTPWDGKGEMPVPIGTPVDVKHRNGDICTGCKAGTRQSDDESPGFAEVWTHHDSDGDITAYRLIPKKEETETPHIPNQETREAIEESREIIAARRAERYKDERDEARELFKELWIATDEMKRELMNALRRPTVSNMRKLRKLVGLE